MTFPSSDVSGTNMDATGDSPNLARVEIDDLRTKFNLLRNHFTAFMQGLINATDPAAARALLVAAKSGANTDITSLGAATGVTAGAGDDSTKLATTAYADRIGATVREIRSISASVAANALTISASAISLEFRSSSLTSGAVTRVAGSPANLVVPSAATLGTVSGNKSRLIVLVLNVAGALELAVVNLAGGNSLDETGLISTTAISSGAAAANVVYSNTARTSLAYRVVGFIESTQAAAGTWATAPSTIQGQGGQALAAMASLGYGQTWQVVTRASGTTYYNTTGRPIAINAFQTSPSTSNSVSLSVGGVTVMTSQFSVGGAVGQTAVSAIIPHGASYVVTVVGAATCVELR